MQSPVIIEHAHAVAVSPAPNAFTNSSNRIPTQQGQKVRVTVRVTRSEGQGHESEYQGQEVKFTRSGRQDEAVGVKVRSQGQ